MTATPVGESTVAELYGGPGGMSEGMRLAGVPSALTVGIDISRDACDTAEKAGHPRLCMSVSDIAPRDYAATYGIPTGVHASPPCPGFSRAGKQEGLGDLSLLRGAAEELARGGLAPAVMAHVRSRQKDDRSALSLEPLRWALDLRPEWVTLEQVPAVLPLWAEYAAALREVGYSVWCGYVTAEQFGVPQTRKRAILMASRVREIGPPVPTHSRFHSRSPKKLDPGLRKWVSMAEALGWGMVRRPYPTVAAGTASGGADPQMLGGSGARLIVAREREAGDGHWIERAMHPEHGDVSFLGAGLANKQQQMARSPEHPAHTITGKGTAVWRFDGQPHVGFPRRYDGGSGGPIEIDGEEYRARDLRPGDEPSFAVTEKARSWKVYDVVDEERFGDLEPTHMGDIYNSKGTVRPLEYPSMAITSSADNGNFRFIDVDRVTDKVLERLNNQSGAITEYDWPAYRPGAVVAGREINTAPGANANRFNGSKKSRNDGVRITTEEAMALQSFRHDYVFVGNKTSQFQQIGNAVPPLMGDAIVRHVYGIPAEVQ